VGPTVRGPVANAMHPHAPLRRCVSLTINSAKAQRYLVLATGDWFDPVVRGSAYPQEGRCVIRLNRRILPTSETWPGEQGAEYGDPHRTFGLATQATARLPKGKTKLDLACAQIQGNFRLARSVLSASPR
jgi:hypothetical protein